MAHGGGATTARTLLAAVVMASATACGRPVPPPPDRDEPHAPSDFVVLADVDPTILIDLRYSTAHNFVGRPVAGYHEPLCILSRRAADALHRVQVAALAEGHTLKVYDCYRPQRATDDFVRWARRPGEDQMRSEFHPRISKSELFDKGYIAARSGHSRGSTVDVTLVTVPAPTQRPYRPGEALVPCTAPIGERFPDNSVDMGTGFDCFDPLAATDSGQVTALALDNRRLLRRLMTDAGFRNHPREWWHYSFAADPYPQTWFDFPVARSAVERR